MSPKQTFFKNIAHIYLLSFCSNFDVKINHYICSVCVAFARLHITDLRFWFCAGDHSFSTQANFFEKVTFLPPDTQTYVCVSMVNKCFFSVNFAYVLNEWPQTLITFYLRFPEKKPPVKVNRAYVLLYATHVTKLIHWYHHYYRLKSIHPETDLGLLQYPRWSTLWWWLIAVSV